MKPIDEALVDMAAAGLRNVGLMRMQRQHVIGRDADELGVTARNADACEIGYPRGTRFFLPRLTEFAAAA